MSVAIHGGDSTNVASVDDNKNLNVTLPKLPAQSGCARILTVDGSAIDVTENNFLRVSSANIVLYDQVDGSTVNTNIWNPYQVSTMAINNANGFYNINSAAATTAGAYAILVSNKFIPFYGTLPLTLEINAKTVNLPEANCTAELGVGIVSVATAPTDGAFFRWNPAGQFVCVISNGGSETVSAALTGTITDADGETMVIVPPVTAVIHIFQIEVVEDLVNFYVDDVLVCGLPVPAGQAFPFNAGRQQVFARVWNGTTPSNGATISIGQVIVRQEDLNQTKPWGDLLATIGRGAYQSPVSAFGQNTNHANSAAPVDATLSNTAAGYATLGGKFSFAAVGAAATDYAIFGFQVPAGYQLIVNSVYISTCVTGIAVVTATVLDWAVGVNSSAVSLATADGTNTWAPRRIPLGVQAFIALAGIGATANDIMRTFPTPLVVDSGRFFHVIVSVPNGAATASLKFRGAITVNGYFE